MCNSARPAPPPACSPLKGVGRAGNATDKIFASVYLDRLLNGGSGLVQERHLGPLRRPRRRCHRPATGYPTHAPHHDLSTPPAPAAVDASNFRWEGLLYYFFSYTDPGAYPQMLRELAAGRAWATHAQRPALHARLPCHDGCCRTVCSSPYLVPAVALADHGLQPCRWLLTCVPARRGPAPLRVAGATAAVEANPSLACQAPCRSVLAETECCDGVYRPSFSFTNAWGGVGWVRGPVHRAHGGGAWTGRSRRGPWTSGQGGPWTRPWGWGMDRTGEGPGMPRSFQCCPQPSWPLPPRPPAGFPQDREVLSNLYPVQDGSVMWEVRVHGIFFQVRRKQMEGPRERGRRRSSRRPPRLQRLPTSAPPLALHALLQVGPPTGLPSHFPNSVQPMDFRWAC